MLPIKKAFLTLPASDRAALILGGVAFAASIPLLVSAAPLLCTIGVCILTAGSTLGAVPAMRLAGRAILSTEETPAKRAATNSSASPANDPSVFSASVQPGEKMPDGTIYAGTSPDTHKPMYTTPGDAPLTMKWQAAMDYAKGLEAHGHDDWRLPSKNELNVLFNNRASIGGFNVSDYDPADAECYWSGTQMNERYAWDQRFSDGYQIYGDARIHSSVRCVR